MATPTPLPLPEETAPAPAPAALPPQANMSGAQAVSILQQLNEINQARNEFATQVNQLLQEPLQQRMDLINEQYAPQIKSATEAGSTELVTQLRNQQELEKEAATTQLEQQAVAQLDAQRAQAGQPTSYEINEYFNNLQPQAQQAITVQNEQGLANQQLAEAQSQVAESDKRAAAKERNILGRLIDAEGDPEKVQAIYDDVNATTDPYKRKETIDMLGRYGMYMPGEGTGYYEMPPVDENSPPTFVAMMPDGSKVSGLTREEAIQMTEESMAVPNINLDQSSRNRRRQEFERLGGFLDATGDGSGTAADVDTSKSTSTTQTGASATAPVSAPGILSSAGGTVRNIQEGGQELVKSFITGKQESPTDKAARLKNSSSADWIQNLGTLAGITGGAGRFVSSVEKATRPARQNFMESQGSLIRDPQAIPVGLMELSAEDDKYIKNNPKKVVNI